MIRTILTNLELDIRDTNTAYVRDLEQNQSNRDHRVQFLIRTKYRQSQLQSEV